MFEKLVNNRFIRYLGTLLSSVLFGITIVFSLITLIAIYWKNYRIANMK